MKLIVSIIKQDIKLACKKNSGVGNMLAFYLMVSSLFVFGIGPNSKDTVLIAPAVIWVCALLVQTITFSRIFNEDYDDGTLAQLILQGQLPEKIVLARIISNWLTGGFLIILSAPILGILFGLEPRHISLLLISLICGTPLLSIISVAAASLTIGANKASTIFGIIALPLYIPVLIFGSSWITSNTVDEKLFTNNMLLLLAMLIFMLPLAVTATVAALKATFED